jgi:hypothetical protein
MTMSQLQQQQQQQHTRLQIFASHIDQRAQWRFIAR